MYEIAKIGPKYEAYNKKHTYNNDIIVGLLVRETEFVKDCKKKILVLATKTENKNSHPEQLIFNVQFNGSDKQLKLVSAALEKNGYVHNLN